MADDMQGRIERLERQHREHVKMCQTRFDEGKTQFATIQKGQEELSEKMDTCTSQLCTLAANTSGMVQLYNDALGAGRTITRLQKFGLGAIKYIGVPAAVIAGVRWLFEQVPPG
jgi:hypothetical protein